MKQLHVLYHVLINILLLGKYPHLEVKHTKTSSPVKCRSPVKRMRPREHEFDGSVRIQFGDVPVGIVSEATIEIINTTPVRLRINYVSFLNTVMMM